MENRLVQAGKILTKTQADAEMDVTDGILNTLFSRERVEDTRQKRESLSRSSRKEFDYALQANSAVQRLLLKKGHIHDLIKLSGQNFATASCGTTKLTIGRAEWIALGGKAEAFTIEDLIFSEDMYVSEEVSIARSMRVAGIPITPLLNCQQTIEKKTVSRVGLWQMTETKEAWAQNVLEELLKLRLTDKNVGYAKVFPVLYKNREWVNDDSLLVRRASDLTVGLTTGTILLVSSDKRLGARMARTIGLTVARVEPVDVILNNPLLVYHAEMSLTPQQVLSTDLKGNNLLVGTSPVLSEILLDTGSLESYALRIVRDQQRFNDPVLLHHRTLISSGFNQNGGRFEVNHNQRVSGRRVTKVYLHTANGATRVTGIRKPEDLSTTESLTLRLAIIGKRFSKG